MTLDSFACISVNLDEKHCSNKSVDTNLLMYEGQIYKEVIMASGS